MPALIITIPFTVNQVIDWINQAVLVIYANDVQRTALEEVGLRCASDVTVAIDEDDNLQTLVRATGLDEAGLRMLCLSLKSAPSISLITHFTSYASIDAQRRYRADEIKQVTMAKVC